MKLRDDRERPLLPPASPSHDEIAARAWRHYQERGMTPGHELEDWLRAERELCEEMDGVTMAEAA